MTITPPTENRSRSRRRLAPILDEITYRYGLLIIWAVVIVAFSVARPNTFLTSANFETIFGSQAVLLILTLALIVPLTAGEFDLSVAGVLGLSLVLVGYVNVIHGWPAPIAVAVALLAGVIVGAVNSVFIVLLGVDSIVITLGMGTLLAGIGLGINDLTVGGISSGLVQVARHEVLGVQAAFYYGLVLTVIVWYVYSHTPLGRYLYFVGMGREVARLAGVRVNAIRSGALLFSGFGAALAGVVLAGTLGAADPNVGPSYLLPAFAAAFLGSTVITPGRFNPWGAFIAVYFLVTGITGLQLIGFVGWVEQVFYGASLVIAVTISRLAARRETGL